MKLDTIFRIDNVRAQVQNEKGEFITFWNTNVLGRWMKKLGLEVKIPYLTGRILPYMDAHNMIVAGGLAGFAARIYDDAVVKKFTVMALGSGNTAVTIADTTLQTEISTNGGSRGSATINRITIDETNDTTIYQKTWNITGPLTVNEAGIFNADNIMLARVIIGPITLDNLYVFTLNWSIKNN